MVMFRTYARKGWRAGPISDTFFNAFSLPYKNVMQMYTFEKKAWRGAKSYKSRSTTL
jgi:hypothetical protein